MARSQRPKIVVVGDSPVALAIRGQLAAQRGSERATSPTRFQRVSALVVAAHDGDFEKSLQAKQPRRRALIEESAERLILDAVIGQVPHVIVVSSAMAHGAEQGREVISDDSPTRELTDGFVGDILHFELSLKRALLNATQGAGGPKLTFLRPAALVGPGIDTLITRHFEAPRLLTLKERSRNWQFVHIDDVAQAVGVVIEKGLTGTLVVGAVTQHEKEPRVKEPGRQGAQEWTAQATAATTSGSADQEFTPDTLSLLRVCALARIRTIELSRATAFAMAESLHQIGVLPAPPVDMEYAVYDWTVMPTRLLEAGWRPLHSSSQCVTVLMQQTRGKVGVGGRRVAPKDAAALGAAGAAVAVLGTAAAWRQVRTGRK